MNFSILSMFMFLFGAALSAHAPDTLWTKTFGGNDIEAANYTGGVS